MVSAAPSAGRSRGPALPWRSRDTLRVCRVMRNISCHRFVGADAHIVPPYRTINNASVGATLAVARGRGRAPPLRIYSLIPRKKEVAGRPPLNFCLRRGAYSSSSWPTRAICSSSSCFCTPHKMAEHFAGSPRRISILGGSEFRLRQGFAVQNAWCGAKAAGKIPHWSGLSPPPAGPPGRYAIRPIAFAPRWTVRPS